jgi:WhiB family redox-sensing transcriptional regulator
MPASPEQWIAALSQTYWISQGSTGRRTDPLTATRTTTRTEGPATVNTRVLDKQREGLDVVARAARLAAEGTPLALREAAAIRDTFVMEAEALTGNTESVRTRGCPACGCFTLLPVKGKAQCINRHCAPRPGLRRRWTFRDLSYTTAGKPRGVQRSEGYPADLRSLAFIADFLNQSGKPVSLSTFQKWVRLHNLPTQKVPGEKALLYALSDVATVHAVQLAAREGQLCGSADRPACAGLADLFYNTDEQAGAMDQNLARRRIAVAKELCAECPFIEPCREAALKPNGKEQHGVAGGLTRNERRDLKTERRATR